VSHDSRSDDVPIILLSGMAADERLFEPQLLRFPNLRVASWIEPQPKESLRSYAARLARLVDPGRSCLVGGASFGGIVALEMAAHLRARACLLIGSVRRPEELPWRWRAFRPAAILGPRGIQVMAALLARVGFPVLSGGRVRRLQRLAQPEAAFVRWAMCAVLRWSPSPGARRIQVFHIHGEADRTLPVQRVRPDVIVPAGGHALPLTNPTAVNEFICRAMEWSRRRS
jgi:pimeloyl-ACP methyl ester carboxylesterase